MTKVSMLCPKCSSDEFSTNDEEIITCAECGQVIGNKDEVHSHLREKAIEEAEKQKKILSDRIRSSLKKRR